jgi:hypothetical protein
MLAGSVTTIPLPCPIFSVPSIVPSIPCQRQQREWEHAPSVGWQQPAACRFGPTPHAL